MNKYNEVFRVIKERCERESKFAEISCFETIAKEADVSLTRLPLYLSHLKDIGLIKYSITDKYIHLTALGRKRGDPPVNAN